MTSRVETKLSNSQINIYLLAAGNNRYTKKPCSLWSFGNGKSILEWQIDTFERSLSNSKINIIVGYESQSIVDNQPGHKFLYSPDWDKSSALHSFLSASNGYNDHAIVMYGDTVFHPETIQELSLVEGDVIIAFDSVWKQRFSGRSPRDISIAETLNIQPYGKVEYTGLVRFSKKVMKWISKRNFNYQSTSTFIDLFSDIVAEGFKVVPFDVAGAWAEMNQPNDLVHFILGNKAETLCRVQPKLKKSKVCDQMVCLWHDWTVSPELEIEQVQAMFGGRPLIVRSSSDEEDSWETASAGVFESILNVDCDDANALQDAIHRVFSSYRERSSDSQVLIQPFVSNVSISGVIFTCDLITGAPYYVINFDDVSGQTDAVTSGRSTHSRTVIAFRNNINSALSIDPRLKKVVDAVRELEEILGYDKLDVEFVIDQDDLCFIFQIRPIVVKHAEYAMETEKLTDYLVEAQRKFNNWQKKPSHIFGQHTVFSGMTDWNPAEIIGCRPNPLAVSLYNHLISEEVHAKQRSEFGYRDIRPSPLVVTFCGQPYVDCRASINSFIPEDLPEGTALRLVDAYMELLKRNPELHDKLESDIVFSIWIPTFAEDAILRFKNQKVTTHDIKILEQSLKKLTANALVRLNDDISSINMLSERLESLKSCDLDPIEKIYQLIENCKKFGTLAFAHAARAGFVAVTLLNNFVKLGSLTQDRMLQFQASVPTVASDLQFALSDPNSGVDALVRQFGHLRPGTYDVTQTAYWEKPEFFFQQRGQSTPIKKADKNDFVFSHKELYEFQRFLNELPLEIKVEELIQYFRQAIQARESTKFNFTRSLSVALDIISQFGTEDLGLIRAEVGYLTIDDISALRTGQLDEMIIPEFVKLRKTITCTKQLAKLPGFIGHKDDFFGYEQAKAKANFITRSSVIAELVFIIENQTSFCGGKIIAIPNADPGFDWVFSRNIVGLITQYGGPNSHMAIRCAELSIPAAIGVGEKLYENLCEGLVILDCKKERLENV